MPRSMQLKASVILVGLVHTHLSPVFNHKVWSIITQALLRVVQFSVMRAQLRVVQLDSQDTIWMMFIWKIISKLCIAENNVCRSEEATELGHIGLLGSIAYQVRNTLALGWLSMWLGYFLELLAQLVNTRRRSHLSTNNIIINVCTQANWDKWLCLVWNCRQ